MPRKSSKSQPWRNAIVRYADEDPTQLLANPANWRVHPKEQTTALVGSLNEVGWIAPVIVNETTQHVVDGHARIGEAIARGESTVPVAYVRLTEAQERLALATFDPISAMAGTDQQMLDELISGITANAELGDLLASLASEQPKQLNPDDADLTPPDEPITKPGDLWLLGEHRLLCGDSTNAADVARLMGGDRATLGLHDPPYGVRAKMSWGFGDGYDDGIAPRGVFPPITGDDVAFDPTHLLGTADVLVLWGANHYADRLPASPSWIVWDKRIDLPENDQSDAELAWVSSGNTAHIFRHRWSGMIRDSERREKREHPTQKPVALMSEVIERYTVAGHILADWYAGSGTTLIAAEQLGRRCYAMEIEPAYCDVIVRRWERVTGGTAQQVHA